MSDPDSAAPAPAPTAPAPAPPVSWPVRAVITLALVFGTVFWVVGFPGLRDFGWRYRIDLDVYRIGAGVWRSGGELYGPMPLTDVGVGLPFTYPPLAAVVFSPLTFIPLAAASTLIALVTVAALAGTIGLWLGALRDRLPLRMAVPGGFAWTVAGLTAAGLWLEPVRATLDFGQVNAILMLLVVADVLLPRTVWPRGVLIGLVAAVKLTPAVFALYFLVRRDWRAFITTIVSFLVFSALGAALAPKDSADYWLDTLIDSGRIGNPAYAANQSIAGVLSRLDITGTTYTVLWLALSLLALALAAVGMARALRIDRPDLALGVNALLGLLVSPVSWTHHWVWIVPIAISLAVSAYRAVGSGTGWWVLLATGLIVFVVAPQWLFATADDAELSWAWWQQIIGSASVWWTIAAMAAVAAIRPADTAAPAPQAVAAD